MSEIISVALKAAQTAGSITHNLFEKAAISHKALNNLVTEADVAAEKAIASIILEAFPTHKILAEELHSTQTIDAEHLWVVDPLDGTNNYAHGIPHYSTSIAYVHKGIIEAGVVFDPMRNELFVAKRGQGATKNGSPIKVSSRPLQEALVVTGFYYDRGLLIHKTLAASRILFDTGIRDLRRTGGAALDLAWVACGRFDAYFEYRLAPWDYAAGKLIVEEAGGKTAERNGHELTLDSTGVIVANSIVFDEIIPLIAWDTVPVVD